MGIRSDQHGRGRSMTATLVRLIHRRSTNFWSSGDRLIPSADPIKAPQRQRRFDVGYPRGGLR
jgi:hypothetical protein